MHEELSVALRIKIKSVSILIRTYMNTYKPHLPVFYLNIRVFKIDLACTKALNFSAQAT